jgi:hypothetical protein
MYRRNLIVACLAYIIVIVLGASAAQAQVLVSAKILSSEGRVEIRRLSPGQPTMTRIKYHVNDELNAGDIVKTHAGGRLVLGLTDGSQAVISENTTVEIENVSRSPRTIFNVLRGKTRVKIEKVGGRPNPYRVNTPTAVIAVRGTLFDVIVKEKETTVFVHEGEVVVSNLLRPDQKVVLIGGQKTRVRQDQAPEPPTHFEPGRNNDIFVPRNGRPSDAVSEAGRGLGDVGFPGQSGNGAGTGVGSAPGGGKAAAPGSSAGKGGGRGRP